MRGSTTNRSKVYSLIGEYHGVVTLSMAENIGVPAVELRKLAQRGAIDRVGRGVYRIPFAPWGSIPEAAEALALIGAEAFLSGATVPALLGIGVFNPRRLEISTTSRFRREVPAQVKLKQVGQGVPVKIVRYHNLPCQPIFEALVTVLPVTDSDKFYTAINDAERLEYLGASDARKLRHLVRKRDLELGA